MASSGGTSADDELEFEAPLLAYDGNGIQDTALTQAAAGVAAAPTHASTKPSVLTTVTAFILVAEFAERLAYYGLGSSLVLYLEDRLHMGNAQADVQFALWSGVCYMTPLLGGYVADSCMGRYRAIVAFCSIYLVGLFVTTLATVPVESDGAKAAAPVLLFIGIYIVALATGGIKSNVSTFGADQFDDNDPRDVKEKGRFFTLFYWSVNAGALISYTLVSYICQYGVPALGGKPWAFVVGFSIPCFAMAAAIVVFKAGSRRYKIMGPAGGSRVADLLSVVREAALLSLRKRQHPAAAAVGDTELSQAPPGNAEAVPAAVAITGSDVSDGWQSLHHRHTDGSQPPPVSDEKAGQQASSSLHWLDRASEAHGGGHSHADVQAVKSLWRLLPLLIMQVPYWAVYSMMSTAYQNQACVMDLSLTKSFSIPVSALNIFDTLAILVLIPIMEAVVYPLVVAVRARRAASASAGAPAHTSAAATNAPATSNALRKIACGFVFAGASVAMAAAVEVWRKAAVGDSDTAPPSHCLSGELADYRYSQFQQFWVTGHAHDRPLHCRQLAGCHELDADGLLRESCILCKSIPRASSLSVLWQIPQFVAIGTSEILASVSAIEFFYQEAPPSMKSTSSALNLLCTALGSWVTIPLIQLVNLGPPEKHWVPDDLNKGHLEYFLCTLAGIMLITILVYVYWARGYHHTKSL